MVWQAVFESARHNPAEDFWWSGVRLRWRGNAVANLGSEKRKVLAQAVLDDLARYPEEMVTTEREAKAVGSALQMFTRDFMLKGLHESEARRYVRENVVFTARLARNR